MDNHLLERARGLVSTSVDDLRSSLNFYKTDNTGDVDIIKLAFQICEKRGEKTKAMMLRRKLKQMEAVNASV